MGVNASVEHQPALALEGAGAGVSMEWDLRGDAQALWSGLAQLAREDVVIGIGAPLLAAAGADMAGLQTYPRRVCGRHTLPATQHALWTLVLGPTPGAVFERAEQLKQALTPWLQLLRMWRAIVPFGRRPATVAERTVAMLVVSNLRIDPRVCLLYTSPSPRD